MKNVIVIGGGPAGMMAAISAGRSGHKVFLLEKNEKLGKKLYITGKGRCNLTNDCDEEEFLENICTNPYFLYSAIYGCNSRSVMDFFEDLGVPLKVERGGRVFPVSEKASDITKALIRELDRLRVKVVLKRKVTGIKVTDGKAVGVITEGGDLPAEAVVVATGGLSYPVTGSDGDGFKFARENGHKVTDLFPSLVPLTSSDNFIESLAGLSLKNVELTLYKGKKNVYNGFGEMLFTHVGISGPLVLSASRWYSGEGKCYAAIDLKPALDAKELDKRILRDFEEYRNKRFKNALDKLLPQKIIPVVIEKSGIEPEKQVNEITKSERAKLVETLKAFRVNISGTEGFKQAVITAGGVDIEHINPSTMESKLVESLYFAGEVIDVDGVTGGFNLQIAFSTGMLAGNSVSAK